MRIATKGKSMTHILRDESNVSYCGRELDWESVWEILTKGHPGFIDRLCHVCRRVVYVP